MELNKILINSLKCKDASEEFKKLDNNKTLEQLIPKINEMKEVGECKYHVVNCFDPVSYTHLDVYKRQCTHRPSHHGSR